MSNKVSIITATYNSEDFILATYNSLTLQSHGNWEWLICDDCSTDHTWSILSKISDADPRVLISKNLVNSGAAISRNNSISKASGEFIAFLDSDDIWCSKKLERQLAFMCETIDFSFTAYRLIDEHGAPLNKFVDLNQRGAFSYEDMLRKKATLGCSTVMLRRKAFPKVTMPLLRTGQDYATWLKLLRLGNTAYVLPEVLTSYRILPNSISRNKFKKARRQWQIYRTVEALPLLKSLECFMFYAWRAIFRR